MRNGYLLNALSKSWKQNLKQFPINTGILVCTDAHIIKKNQEC